MKKRGNRKDSPKPLADLLPSSLLKSNAGRTVLATMLAERVVAAIGECVPSAEGRVRCTKIVRGVAHVSAETSVIAEEVRLNAAAVLDALDDGEDPEAERDVTRIRIVA